MYPASSLEFPLLEPKDESDGGVEDAFSEIAIPPKSNEIEFTLEMPSEKPEASEEETSASKDTPETDAEKLFSKLKKE